MDEGFSWMTTEPPESPPPERPSGVTTGPVRGSRDFDSGAWPDGDGKVIGLWPEGGETMLAGVLAGGGGTRNGAT
jgi:hypothetical protein